MKATIRKNMLSGPRLESFDVDCIEKELSWQKAGLQQTASGYGYKLTTRYMVRLNGKWRRVYACQYSNVGTLYLPHKLGGFDYIIEDITE